MSSGRQPVAVRFGANLKRCRKGVGISQEELGFRAGLHRTEVGMLERGIRLPRIDTLVRLAGSLGLPPRDLLVGLKWTPRSVEGGGFSLGGEDESDEGEGPTGCGGGRAG